jgi:hypothetical protein
MTPDERRAEYIRKLVAQAPPLTDRQRERLSMLLRPGVIAAHRQLRAQSRSATGVAAG